MTEKLILCISVKFSDIPSPKKNFHLKIISGDMMMCGGDLRGFYA